MALIAAKKIRLRDGTEVLLRCADDRDALALLEAARVIFADGDGMAIDPDEFEKTEDQEKAWIVDLNDNPRNLLLVAEVGGGIVGNIDFHSSRRRRLAHTGEFGLSVQPAWRSRGVGTALLERLIEWARGVQEVEKISLKVRADNRRAIAVYTKLGFVQCGVARDAMKLPDGVYVDDILMERFVRQ
jgi:RimJ/RimL family protein N-acetyltransferase